MQRDFEEYVRGRQHFYRLFTTLVFLALVFAVWRDQERNQEKYEHAQQQLFSLLASCVALAILCTLWPAKN